MIGDDIADALPILQAEAESMMTDTCKTTRPGPPTTDPATGATIPGDVPIYTGICKQQDSETTPHGAEAGDATTDTIGNQIHVPVAAPKHIKGDVIEILTSIARPSSVGRKVRVLAPHQKTWQTAQRLRVEEVI